MTLICLVKQKAQEEIDLVSQKAQEEIAKLEAELAEANRSQRWFDLYRNNPLVTLVSEVSTVIVSRRLPEEHTISTGARVSFAYAGHTRIRKLAK